MHSHDYLHDKANVVGVGTDAEDGHVVAFVSRKRPVAELDPDDVVPEKIEGQETEVIEADFSLDSAEPYDATEHPYPNREERFAPLVGGIQIQADDAEGVGTVGSPLMETADGESVALTNEHVVDPAVVGDAVRQPDSDGELIGHVADRSTVFKDGDYPEAATADAALISVEPAEWSDRVLGFDERPGGWRPAEKYDRVQKSGRTTGVTDGLVFSLDADLRVKVGETEDNEDIRVEFAPVYVATVATAAGDSGSLWIAEEDNHAVGLHFAGGGGLAAAIPWPAVRAAVGELSFVEPPNGDADEDTGRGVLPGGGPWLRRLFDW